MNTQAIIQLITGAVGSVAFGMLFHMKSKYLPLAGAGGFLSWLVFLIGKTIWGSVFLPTLLAGFIADLYAEILARICKETSTSFFVTSVIPLIPGSTLYYCMNSIMEGNTMQALAYGRDTFLFCIWNCGRNEYWMGNLLFFQNCKKANEPLGFLSARGSFASTFFLSAF